jgi:lambda family phage portal protein
MTEVKQQSRPWLDRAIEYVAPSWAVRREWARTTLEASHRGGIQTRTSTPWGSSVSFRGGTMSGRMNLADQCSRARRVYSEHPVGRSLLKTETDNVIGDGLTLQGKTASKEFNREAEERWVEWMDRADIRGLENGSDLQRRFYRSPRRDGDGGMVLVDRGGESRLQYIPRDLICTPDDKHGETTIIDGIEVNAACQPVAFHVLDTDERGKRRWTRVPAPNFVYNLPEFDEDLAVRGPTCYSQIFSLLDGLDGYVDAVIIAARMAAVFGLIFKDANANQQYAALGTLANSQGQQQKGVTLENGMVKYVGGKDDVVQVQAQQPMNQTPDFIRAVCRLLGLPFDMPLELVLKDVSQVNFSSARVGLLGYYRACRARQKPYRVKWDRIYQWWISRERKRQELGLPGAFVTAFPENYWAHRFGFQGWDYTDPVSESQADLLQIDMGVKTPQMVAAERGRDWEEMQEELAVARALRRLSELPEMHSTLTRDEKQSVVAVDSEGNPVASGQQPLNGVQITAAMDVVAKLAERTIPATVAIEMLERLGIAQDRAAALAKAAEANRTGITASDREYQRQVLLKLLDVQGAKQTVYNLTDVEDLISQTGLPPEKPVNGRPLQAPFLPVVSDTGPLVSGATIQDPEGDIVGGDVENELPAESDGRNELPGAGAEPEDDNQ